MQAKNYFWALLLAGLLLGGTLSVNAQEPAPNPYSIRQVSLGWSGAQVEERLGRPTFTAKKKKSWHYRNRPGAPSGVSDPQITFREDRVRAVVGSRLERQGQEVLKKGDSEERLLQVLGSPTKRQAGVHKGTEVFFYPQWKLQVVTLKGKIMAFSLNEEFATLP